MPLASVMTITTHAVTAHVKLSLAALYHPLLEMTTIGSPESQIKHTLLKFTSIRDSCTDDHEILLIGVDAL